VLSSLIGKFRQLALDERGRSLLVLNSTTHGLMFALLMMMLGAPPIMALIWLLILSASILGSVAVVWSSWHGARMIGLLGSSEDYSGRADVPDSREAPDCFK
jgi:hypothetical protein